MNSNGRNTSLPSVIVLETPMPPDESIDVSVSAGSIGNEMAGLPKENSDSSLNLLDLTKEMVYHRAVQRQIDKAQNQAAEYWQRYKNSQSIEDLDMTIYWEQEVINLSAVEDPNTSLGDGHRNKFEHLNSLRVSLVERFKRLGDETDIDKAITILQETVDLTPDGHSNKPTYLSDLGGSLASRFERSGKVADIDRSIVVLQQAVDLSPDGHSNKPTYLSNLGGSLARRFERSGEVADIDKSIVVLQQAVDLTPDGHSNKPTYLSNLGNSLARRFERSGEVADIDKSIVVLQQAVDLTPDGHAGKPTYLSNLGNSLARRFERSGEVADIDKSIVVQQQAVDLAPDGHADKPGYLSNLGNSLLSRFERSGEVADIDKSILLQQRAIHLTPEDSIKKHAFLINLGQSFKQRFLYNNKRNDLHQCLSSFYYCATSQFASPHDRLTAARQWALLAASYSPHDIRFMPLRACHVFMSLVPRVVWLGNSISLRYQDIAQVGSFINTTAFIACATRHHDLALEWLDQGRSIIWGQILRLRTPMDDLKRDHPDLATSIEDISRQLDAAHIHATSLSTNASLLADEGERSAQTQRRLAEEWDRLLLKVRQRPGYRSFLQPKKLASLASAAALGPVVFINIDEHGNGCGAIILRSINGRVKSDHVDLSRASLAKIKGAHSAFAKALNNRSVRHTSPGVYPLKEQASSPVSQPMEEDQSEVGDDDFGSAYPNDSRASRSAPILGNVPRVLRMLWIDIVGPIFRALGYTKVATSKSAAQRKLPRVTWCTTGPLAFLPLHAAGIYNKDGSMSDARAYKYAVSSYTPSLSMLLRREPGMESQNSRGLAAISQPSTPNQTPLPKTVDEVSRIQNQLETGSEGFLWLNDTEATRDAVTQQMKARSWIHLACHGVQHKDDPMQSAFMLHDGPLDLRAISQQSLPNARLAFLSACQTAKGDDKLPEESAHLAAGMLMIGYHTVIGTMWSINDSDAPVVAEEFYEYLKGRGMKTNDGQAAYALHEAVANLREKVGEDKFLSWVPFIHLGI